MDDTMLTGFYPCKPIILPRKGKMFSTLLESPAFGVDEKVDGMASVWFLDCDLIMTRHNTVFEKENYGHLYVVMDLLRKAGAPSVLNAEIYWPHGSAEVKRVSRAWQVKNGFLIAAFHDCQIGGGFVVRRQLLESIFAKIKTEHARLTQWTADQEGKQELALGILDAPDGDGRDGIIFKRLSSSYSCFENGSREVRHFLKVKRPREGQSTRG